MDIQMIEWRKTFFSRKEVHHWLYARIRHKVTCLSFNLVERVTHQKISDNREKYQRILFLVE